MTTTYELYTNENGTPKLVEGKAPAIIERVEALEETLGNGVVTSVNGKTGVVTVDVGVTSFNGSKGAVTYSAPVSSVNGKTGAVTVDVGVTSVNGKTGAVTGIVTSVNGTNADASGNVTLQLGGSLSLVTSGTWTTTNKSTSFTVTGITPYKPLFIVVKTSAYKLTRACVTSGVLDTCSNVLSDTESQNGTNFIYSNHSDARGVTMICIPNATSISIQYHISANTPYYIYQ